MKNFAPNRHTLVSLFGAASEKRHAKVITKAWRGALYRFAQIHGSGASGGTRDRPDRDRDGDEMINSEVGSAAIVALGRCENWPAAFQVWRDMREAGEPRSLYVYTAMLTVENIVNGTTRWCQGFSEPNSGSDLASLKTAAVLDGDEWIINGQKVWTTGGHHADYCFLLTRTDPDAPKHKGISYLLVPMRQEGVEVRGIVQPDGTAEFCEVFFTNARCPKDNVVGGVNNGWKVTNSTLAFERGMSATTGYRRFEEEYKMMVRVATENGAIEHDDIRQRLMQYYTKIQLLRINGLRSLTATLNNSKDFGVMALGASNKMFWSEMHKAAMELALDIFGAQGMLVDAGPETGSWPGVAREKRREGYPVSPMMSAFFFSRSETIWGGTSQIQRNIVGERVLGLPKEPSPG